jgi:ankyrin repeat protein
VHCQVETLRRCFPPSIRRILRELPKTLDETYERMLMEIDEEKRRYANRLFQCLVISIRPLRVEELAELFAILPNEESTPGFNIGWRPEDPEAFILSACSTLVSIVYVQDGKVVQFSHGSVREYLTSSRIANSAPVSHFHILPKPAHTVLARACLSVLLQLDDTINRTKIQNFPLAWYAAEHWLDHARFEDVSSDVRDAMDCLFDKNKPHFAAWLWLYDVEKCRRRWRLSLHPMQPDTVPLYYAVMCGFRSLAQRLLEAHPRDVNARGGDHGTPLHAAVHQEDLDLVVLLLERGADMESRDRHDQTALYVASSCGYAEVVRSLIDRGADLNVECGNRGGWFKAKWTPLHVASKNGWLEVAGLLLVHGTGVNHQDNWGKSALHIASRHASSNLVRLLLDHGANAYALDNWGETALHEASSYGRITVVKSLLEYGANVDAMSKWGMTPLHCAAIKGHLEVIHLLLDHDADVNAQNEDRRTALDLASLNGHVQVVEVLLKRSADPHARTRTGETHFQLASSSSSGLDESDDTVRSGDPLGSETSTSSASRPASPDSFERFEPGSWNHHVATRLPPLHLRKGCLPHSDSP